MKLKRLPEDFQVEELTEFALGNSGEFAFYRLTKRGLGTPEAIEAVLRRWHLSRRQISYGGMKDRHAVTTQLLTIHRGPRRHLRQTNLDLEYLGRADRPFAPSDIAGNRFQIVMRSMSHGEIAEAEKAIEEIRRDGLPNYFDDQRFGSLGESGEFVARAWIAGDYERALWLALADANPLDRPGDREEKRLLREHWGDWATCAAKLDRSHRSQIVQHLCRRPGDFRGALARVRQDQRMLYLAAFQSCLWNRLLAALLTRTCTPDQLVPVPLKIGRVPFFGALSDGVRRVLHAANLPLPSARIKLDEGPLNELVAGSLNEIGLSMRQIRVKYPRDSFFSKGWRRALFAVTKLSYDSASDELYSRRQKLTLRFDLPRGSYATILVKRVTVAAGIPIGSGPEEAEGEFREEESETVA